MSRPKTKQEKRQGALDRMQFGKPHNPAKDKRVKTNPRTEEERLAEMATLRKRGAV